MAKVLLFLLYHAFCDRQPSELIHFTIVEKGCYSDMCSNGRECTYSWTISLKMLCRCFSPGDSVTSTQLESRRNCCWTSWECDVSWSWTGTSTTVTRPSNSSTQIPGSSTFLCIGMTTATSSQAPEARPNAGSTADSDSTWTSGGKDSPWGTRNTWPLSGKWPRSIAATLCST